MRRIVVIVNPDSGGWRRLDRKARRDPVAAVARWIAPEAPDRLRVLEIRAPEQGISLAREALRQDCDLMVAAGGDGTINAIAQALVKVPPVARPLLGILPLGTANVLARLLGLPYRDPQASAHILHQGRVQTIDLGQANGQVFVLMAGVGFDACVTKQVSRRLKRLLGRGAYLLSALKVACAYPRHPLRLTLDKGTPQDLDAYMVLVTNSRYYAGSFDLGASIHMDDGLLDIFAFPYRRRFLAALTVHAFALWRQRLPLVTEVRHWQSRRIILDSSAPIPVQFDGDYALMTPVSIEVLPAALRVLVR